jgi:Tol biopolymer transport system component
VEEALRSPQRIAVGSDWSPAGDMVCYVADPVSPPGPLGLWIVGVDPSAKGTRKSGTPVLVSQGDFYGPVWSHDGTRIALLRSANSWWRSAHPRSRSATGAKRTLETMPGLLPNWSSTDDRIAFTGVLAERRLATLYHECGLFRNTQVTVYDQPVLWPAWSPDGQQMAFRVGSGLNWDASIY